MGEPRVTEKVYSMPDDSGVVKELSGRSCKQTTKRM